VRLHTEITCWKEIRTRQQSGLTESASTAVETTKNAVGALAHAVPALDVKQIDIKTMESLAASTSSGIVIECQPLMTDFRVITSVRRPVVSVHWV
jgi:hypothetical protein